MKLTEELLREIGLTPRSVPSPDTRAAAQFEQLSIAKFRSHDGPTKELRHQHVELLREAIIYGVLAVVTTPLDHPERTGRRTRLHNNIVGSFVLFLATGRFHQSVLVGAISVFQLLQDTEVGFDIENQGHCKLLNLAIFMGNDYVTGELLERGVNASAKDIKGMTSLHYVALYGRWTMIQPLKKLGADFHAKVEPISSNPYDGATALHIAALRGDKSTVRELLFAGANVDEQDRRKAKTALFMAAERGREDVVRLLIENGASVDGSPNCHGSPLINACVAGHEAVVRLLLTKGADISRTDSEGDPALHNAAFHGKEAIVRLLLDHGFSPEVKGKSGHTAVWWARKGDHQEIARLLVERGGNDRDRPDILDDSKLPLYNIAGGLLLEHIERAQQMMFHISEIQHWVKSLRFVVSAEEKNKPDYDFELIEVDAGDINNSNEPYIAVSYCWESEANKKANPLRIRVPLKHQPGAKEVRSTTAPTNILRRSMAFAAAKGIRRIWIDQECIYQDDEKDKTMAIQCMHLVYQQAAITLVILDEHVRTHEDIRVISDLKRQGENLRDRILRDNWFFRAWPAQEYANSTAESLSYLIGWKDDLDISGDAWEREATDFNVRAINPHSRVELIGEDVFNKAPQQKVRRAWELDVDFIRSLSFKGAGDYSRVMQGMVNSIEWTSEEKAYRLLDQDDKSEGWWEANE
jgi:ankyrin repeat protein